MEYYLNDVFLSWSNDGGDQACFILQWAAGVDLQKEKQKHD